MPAPRRPTITIGTSQLLSIFLAIMLAGAGFYVSRLQSDLDRLITTQRAEIERIAVLETQAKYNAAAIGSIDDRLRREVEIPQYCGTRGCP